jgi:hypothetical protein
MAHGKTGLLIGWFCPSGFQPTSATTSLGTSTKLDVTVETPSVQLPIKYTQFGSKKFDSKWQHRCYTTESDLQIFKPAAPL